MHTCSVNDVCVHPNQGELISCDQAGCIKQWDLSENLCSHELVRQFISTLPTPYHACARLLPAMCLSGLSVWPLMDHVWLLEIIRHGSNAWVE